MRLTNGDAKLLHLWGRFVAWVRPARFAHAGGRTGRMCLFRGSLFGLVASLIFLGLWTMGSLQPLEWYMLDARYVFRFMLASDTEPSPVTVVAIDDLAVAKYGRWPWPRNVQAGIIRSILEAEPAVLGIDILYSTASEDFRGDQLLAESLRSTTPVVLAASVGGEREQLPLLSLLAPNTTIGHVDSAIEFDGLVRRLPLEVMSSMGELKTLSWEMVDRLVETGQAPADALEAPLRASEDGSLWINFRPGVPGASLAARGIAETVSVVDVVDGRATESIRGRPVLLGVTGTGSENLDLYLTPLRPAGRVSGVYLHAAALNSILHQDFVKPQPLWQVALLLLVGGAAVGGVSFLLRPWPSTLLILIFLGSYGWFALQRFITSSEWIVVTPFAFVVLCAYIGGLWHAHLVVEREERRVRATFRRYVAPEVVDALLMQPGAAQMGGGRRSVTVLFADIRGFTRFAEKTPPEQVVAVLNRYLAIMSESVLLYGGMVDKFLGDGLMALFGAPLQSGDHPEAAVRAGMHLLRRLESVTVREDGAELRVGIGIHTGDAVVGSIGAATRMEYTAIGDTVNVAARLQELARPGTLLVSDATYSRLPAALQRRGALLAPVQVRGRSEAVTAYQFLPVAPAAQANAKVQGAAR